MNLRLLVVLCVLWGGCHSEICATDAAIVPGAGVDLDGRMICLGRTATQVEEELGAPGTRQDLGAAGVRVLYPDLDVTLLYEADTLRAITLHNGVKVTTSAGLGIGSTEGAVRAELGTPVIDPILGAWLYDDDGLTLLWEKRKVAQIQLAVQAQR